MCGIAYRVAAPLGTRFGRTAYAPAVAIPGPLPSVRDAENFHLMRLGITIHPT